AIELMTDHALAIEITLLMHVFISHLEKGQGSRTRTWVSAANRGPLPSPRTGSHGRSSRVACSHAVVVAAQQAVIPPFIRPVHRRSRWSTSCACHIVWARLALRHQSAT